MKKYTTQVFIEKSKLIHQNKYDYSLTEYINSKNKVIITCPIHGNFEQTPARHLMGDGCPSCGGTKKLNFQDFVFKANKIHNYKYNYDKVIYKNNYTKIIITCPIHGDFEQTPNNHLNGQNCPLCSNMKHPNIKQDLQEFIKKAIFIHGNKYDYSKVNYVNSKTKICIICPEHGEFYQTPDRHINERQGCPKCKMSHGEELILNLLKANKINFIFQHTINVPENIRKSKKALIDFYLPQHNIFIEYNGIQHYQYVPYLHKGGIVDFISQQKRDKYIKEYCKFNNIKFIEISYKYTNEEINLIINKLF